MIERIIQASLAAVLLCVSSGCRKSAAPEKTGGSNAPVLTNALSPAVETIAELHWVGKVKAAEDTNLAGFMSIWNLPESTNLEAQVVSRLATAPWRLFTGAPSLTNAPTHFLTPLIQDLINHDAYWEVRQVTNGPVSMALGVRLPAERRIVWETNLAIVCENLTGGTISTRTNGGWRLRKPNDDMVLDLIIEDDWVMWACGREWNVFLDEFCMRLKTNSSPSLKAHTNYFLQAELDLPKLSLACGLDRGFSTNLPRTALHLSGNGPGIRTSGDLVFEHALSKELEAWSIPTNLIHDPLVSFTAIRGAAPFLKDAKCWKTAGFESPPDQFYAWAQLGMPFLSYCAVPAPNALNVVVSFGSQLDSLNPWMTNRAVGFFTTNSNKVLWESVPLIAPFIAAETKTSPPFIVGGLVPILNTNQAIPKELLAELHNSPNVLAYDWELTGPRLEQWLNFGQLIRFALAKAQLPPASPSFTWLKALSARLENSATRISSSGQNRITIVRNSSLGLTAVELMIFCDWLESTQFPIGMHTLTGKPEEINPGKRRFDSKKEITSPDTTD